MSRISSASFSVVMNMSGIHFVFYSLTGKIRQRYMYQQQYIIFLKFGSISFCALACISFCALACFSTSMFLDVKNFVSIVHRGSDWFSDISTCKWLVIQSDIIAYVILLDFDAYMSLTDVSCKLYRIPEQCMQHFNCRDISQNVVNGVVGSTKVIRNHQ